MPAVGAEGQRIVFRAHAARTHAPGREGRHHAFYS